MTAARELQARLEAERRGHPFLRHPAPGQERIATLRAESFTVGRGDGCDLQIEMDPEISRVHAELRRIGEDWVIADDGLSRNGTWVNDERLTARRRLLDGDVVRCGETRITFHDPRESAKRTRPAADRRDITLTDSQRRVLLALCRPLCDDAALPASNRQIADELHLSLGGVKSHLRTLFDKLEVEADLPHTHKRLRLSERAIETGIVRMQELRDDT